MTPHPPDEVDHSETAGELTETEDMSRPPNLHSDLALWLRRLGPADL